MSITPKHPDDARHITIAAIHALGASWSFKKSCQSFWTAIDLGDTDGLGGDFADLAGPQDGAQRQVITNKVILQKKMPFILCGPRHGTRGTENRGGAAEEGDRGVLR